MIAVLDGTSKRRTRMKFANNIKLSTYRLLIKKRGLSVDRIRHKDFSDANFNDANFNGVNFYRANFSGASFNGANFSGANFYRANFDSVIGDSRLIHTIQTNIWHIVIYSNRMQIGCENHTIKRWMSYDYSDISVMNSKALSFWKIWKPIIVEYIKAIKGEKE
jgi:hypothetical protein